MCGIVGYLGVYCAVNYLFNGILALQNRGYDSVGMTTMRKHKLITSKFANTDCIQATELLKSNLSNHYDSNIGIAHCRWATHGAKTDINAHPHHDYTNTLSLVHNGIIDNHNELRQDLISNYNVKFQSQTDSEVIVNLISIYYKLTNDMSTAIKLTIDKLIGTWAVVLINSLEPDKLYCFCNECPLMIGTSDDHIMVCSEQYGFCNKIDNYFCLENNDLVIIHNNTIITNHEYVYHEIDHSINTNNETIIIDDFCDINSYSSHHDTISPTPYLHWTIKEICDQPHIIINMSQKTEFPELDLYKEQLLKTNNIILLGCGTSYNACCFVSCIFRNIDIFSSVHTYDGAEFDESLIPKLGKTILILVSQSGETKDLQRCVSIAKKHDLFTIGVINVQNSWISREVNTCLYTHAGREYAVASTKAYTSQVCLLVLIAKWFLTSMFVKTSILLEVNTSMNNFGNNIYSILNNNVLKKKCSHIAKILIKHNSCFILGKGECEYIAKEAALKLKELGYIHAEGYNSSTLKHGSYSLITSKFPVILIMPSDKHLIRNKSILEEIKSRDAFTIVISDCDYIIDCDYYIQIHNNDQFTSLLSMIPLQLISYYMALLKGHNPDMPRNLAKVVTVD